MSLRKAAIHTTLSRECRDWLQKESIETSNYEGEIIETAILFYRNNRVLIEEYQQARIFLRELIKTELVDDYAKARPLLKRLIEEEIKNHSGSK
ncbi:MAG: hypothetical protein V1854_01830 [Methanobacteriota archaeon]